MKRGILLKINESRKNAFVSFIILINLLIALTQPQMLFSQTNKNLCIDSKVGLIDDQGLAVNAFLKNPMGIAVDVNDAIYIADTNHHRLRRILSGKITTIAGTGVAGYDGENIPAISAAIYYPTDVAIDSHGNIYIVEHKGHRIRKIDTDGIISTYAGTGTSGYSGDGGFATAAQLCFPTGISIDYLDNLYIADYMNHRIRVVDSSNQTIQTFAGTGTPGKSGDGGNALSAELNMPFGVYADSFGNIWIADTGNNLVRKVNIYRRINTVAGNGTLSFGKAIDVKLNQPTRVSLDDSGNLYISETGQSLILKVPDGDPNQNILVYAGGGNNHDYNGSQAIEAELTDQQGIAFGRDNTLYIADTNNHFCSKVDSSGNIEIVAGTVNPFPRKIQSTSLNNPSDIIQDNEGAYYISDTKNHMILKVINDDIYRFGGNGEQARTDNCGNGNLVEYARLNEPKNLLFQSKIDPLTYEYAEYLYIAEPNLHWIRRVQFTEDGDIINTFAGTGNIGTPDDYKPPQTVDLKYPLGMYADSNGDIYFADRDNNCIFKIIFNPYNGYPSIVRFAGQPDAGNSPSGTSALDAKLNKPVDVWIDNAERIYVLDSGNARVCRIDKNNEDIYVITEVVSNLENPMGITGYVEKRTKKEFIIITDADKNQMYEIDLDECPCDAKNYVIAGKALSKGGFSGDGDPALQAELNGPSGIMMNSEGDILFADSANNRIRILSPQCDDSDDVIRTIAGFYDPAGSSLNVAIREVSGIVSDPDGHVYYSDSKNHRVLKIYNGNVESIAGNGTAGYSGDGDFATLAQLNSPQGLEYANGILYITDKGNHSVRKVENGIITTIIGNGIPGIGSPDDIYSSCLNLPVDVAIKGDELYISDSNNHRIIRYNIRYDYFSVLIGNGYPGKSTVGTSIGEAQLNTPAGISFNNDGILLISEMGNHRIIKIENREIILVAGTGETSLNNAPYPKDYNLNVPSDVIVDDSNNIYISDTGHNLILKISNNFISTFAGNQSDGCNNAEGLPRKEISLNKPSSIFIHGNYMYIADKCHRIGKTYISTDNAIYQNVAGNGYSGFSGNNGPAISASLDSPYDVAIDQWNNIFIADFKNHQIRKITPDGTITTIAGTGNTVYDGDNDLAVNTNLDSPHSVAVDLEGNVYVADTNHHLIRKILKDSQKMINLVGTPNIKGSPETNDDGFVPDQVFLNAPHGLAVDTSGNIYIADTGNKKVRIVEAGERVVNIAQYTDVTYPYDVAVDKHLNVYVSDMMKHKVFIIQPGSNPTSYVGDGEIDYIYSEENQSALSSSLYSPTFLDVDEESNLYIVDSGHNRIRKVYSERKTIVTIAGDGLQGFSGEKNNPLFASLNTPNGIAVEPGGNILISDTGNNYIRKLFLKKYPIWDVNISDFYYKEKITAVVLMNGRNFARQGDKLAFFIDNECRGLAYPVNTIKGERFFAIIWAENKDINKEISVKYYRKSTSEILIATETLVYQPNTVLGTIENPEPLNFPIPDNYPIIIAEQAETIKSQAQTITDQANTIKSQAQTITDQAITINSQADTITDQANTIKSQAQTITDLEIRIDKLSSYSTYLAAGWHLLSSINDFNITPQTTPANCIEIMYEYDINEGKYKIINELSPTKGFWVKLKEACEITVSAAQD